nr:rRNA small subunit methyltransferase B [Ipomoea batatas]
MKAGNGVSWCFNPHSSLSLLDDGNDNVKEITDSSGLLCFPASSSPCSSLGDGSPKEAREAVSSFVVSFKPSKWRWWRGWRKLPDRRPVSSPRSNGSSTLASLLGSGVYSSDGSLEVSGEEAASGGDQRWPLFRSAMAEYDNDTNIPVSLLRSVVAAARRGEATAAWWACGGDGARRRLAHRSERRNTVDAAAVGIGTVGTLTNNVYHTWINCVPDERDMNDESLEVEGPESRPTATLSHSPVTTAHRSATIPPPILLSARVTASAPLLTASSPRKQPISKTTPQHPARKSVSAVRLMRIEFGGAFADLLNEQGKGSGESEMGYVERTLRFCTRDLDDRDLRLIVPRVNMPCRVPFAGGDTLII